MQQPRLRFQFPIIFGSRQSGHSSRLKMLATNGESSLVGHCHVNSLRRRFTTFARDPRSHSQLPKVRLASRSQQKFFAKVSLIVVVLRLPGAPWNARRRHRRRTILLFVLLLLQDSNRRRNSSLVFSICRVASRISSVSDRCA